MLFINIKGIVYLKIKSLSSSTHPQFVPNMYELPSSAEHKTGYLSVTQELMDPIDFHSIFIYFYVNGVHQLFGYPYSSK